MGTERPVLVMDILQADGSHAVDFCVFCPRKNRTMSLDYCRSCPEAIEVRTSERGGGACIECTPRHPLPMVRDEALGTFLQNGVFCVREDVPIAAIIRLMMEREISHVYVVNEHRELLGIVRERDLLLRETAPGETSKDIASAAVALADGLTIRAALLQMALLHVREAAVVSCEGALIGIVRDVEGLGWFAAARHEV